MRKLLLPLLAGLALLMPITDDSITAALHTGELLRMHVIAQDDTPAMQSIKYPVRDAVRQVYADQADADRSMLSNTQALLPQMTQTAQQTAQQLGFTGSVDVLLGCATFDERTLNGITVPAGDYPALIVRLGEARGHNWWGLVDPQRSLMAACIQQDEGLTWDWSMRGFWQALLRSMLCTIGGDAA